MCTRKSIFIGVKGHGHPGQSVVPSPVGARKKVALDGPILLAASGTEPHDAVPLSQRLPKSLHVPLGG